jgi:hypothetical protein
MHLAFYFPTLLCFVEMWLRLSVLECSVAVVAKREGCCANGTASEHWSHLSSQCAKLGDLRVFVFARSPNQQPTFCFFVVFVFVVIVSIVCKEVYIDFEYQRKTLKKF